MRFEAYQECDRYGEGSTPQRTAAVSLIAYGADPLRPVISPDVPSLWRLSVGLARLRGRINKDNEIAVVVAANAVLPCPPFFSPAPRRSISGRIAMTGANN